MALANWNNRSDILCGNIDVLYGIVTRDEVLHYETWLISN